MNSLGNPDILKNHKIAFLCSRRYPAGIVPKAYDWAIAQREAGRCVVSGFHSPIEKDVLGFLLKGIQPIIVVLARGLPKRLDPRFAGEIAKGRLLVVSPFPESVTRASAETAFRHNRFMIELADEVMIAHATKGGMLERLSTTIQAENGSYSREFATQAKSARTSLWKRSSSTPGRRFSTWNIAGSDGRGRKRNRRHLLAGK